MQTITQLPHQISPDHSRLESSPLIQSSKTPSKLETIPELLPLTRQYRVQPHYPDTLRVSVLAASNKPFETPRCFKDDLFPIFFKRSEKQPLSKTNKVSKSASRPLRKSLSSPSLLESIPELKPLKSKFTVRPNHPQSNRTSDLTPTANPHKAHRYTKDDSFPDCFKPSIQHHLSKTNRLSIAAEKQLKNSIIKGCDHKNT